MIYTIATPHLIYLIIALIIFMTVILTWERWFPNQNENKIHLDAMSIAFLWPLVLFYFVVFGILNLLFEGKEIGKTYRNK